MEWLNTIWNWVLPIGGGITLGALIITIGTLLLKSAFAKITAKLNIEAIEKKAVDKGIDKIKEISFNQTIQPVLESGLRAVSEEVREQFIAEIANLRNDYAHLLAVLVALSAYFDNSVGVPDEVKETLKEAIAQAQYLPVEPLRLQVGQVDEPSEKTATNENTPPKTAKRTKKTPNVQR